MELRARAASGHVGATLTAGGAASLDAVVSVYWPAELQWFTGRLVAFNPLEPAFLVLYSGAGCVVLCAAPSLATSRRTFWAMLWGVWRQSWL